jgi:hypothetical protein
MMRRWVIVAVALCFLIPATAQAGGPMNPWTWLIEAISGAGKDKHATPAKKMTKPRARLRGEG